MGETPSHGDGTLEEHAIAAHRAYIDALVLWERALHLAKCPRCNEQSIISDNLKNQCTQAEIEKERKRVEFGRLCDKLGFVPNNLNARLPAESAIADCTGAAIRGMN